MSASIKVIANSVEVAVRFGEKMSMASVTPGGIFIEATGLRSTRIVEAGEPVVVSRKKVSWGEPS